MAWFEKFAAFLFLVMLVGVVAFLTFVPMPVASEKVILMIIGALVAASTGALPRLFGSDNSKEKALEAEVSKLRDELAKQKSAHDSQMAAMEAKLLTVSDHYLAIVQMLVDRHLQPGKGVGEVTSHG